MVVIGSVLLVGKGSAQSWRNASRAPVGLAPDPATTVEAVVQVYSARAVSWRGYVGVHSWIAVKPRGAAAFAGKEKTRLERGEVNGWRLRRSGSAVVVSDRPPDGRWFGKAPELLADLRGDPAESAIQRIETAVGEYPFAHEYRVWPGPNSNTFTAFVLRDVPELRVDLPATAIGKDYLGNRLIAEAPSGTGIQLSVLGLVGVMAAIEEGLEINLFGLTFGIDPLQFSLKLPFVGRLGAGISSLLLGAFLVGGFAIYKRPF